MKDEFKAYISERVQTMFQEGNSYNAIKKALLSDGWLARNGVCHIEITRVLDEVW